MNQITSNLFPMQTGFPAPLSKALGQASPGLPWLARNFDPISLKQMDAVALLNRTDTKFILTNAQLIQALAAVRQDYWMLSVNGQRLNHYRTLYFDTSEFQLYHLHVNGHLDRYKVRSREYTDSGLSFFEVKHKTSKGRTIKARLTTPEPVTEITRQEKGWLKEVYPYPEAALEPKIWNTFTRLTLVSKRLNERVTLDIDLAFFNGTQAAYLGELAIAEVKMDAARGGSAFLEQMRLQKILSHGFSKYCMGVSMLYDQVKKNSLKPKRLWLDRLAQGA
ncbi:MAG: polyphosphate polymerase domain-containing protein [Anaerolineales bacterium]|jgi:hypothetical protein|nr:polyphosphate polymerase domain-containing protein [Anaerolineales bacterium]